MLIRFGILIVDSNPYFRRTLRGILHGQGARSLIEADSYDMARKKCFGHMPQLIFIDWPDSRSEAGDFLGDLRAGALGSHPETPLVATSVKPDRPFLLHIRELGASGCVLKPFSEKVIGRYLDRLRDVSRACAEPSEDHPDRVAYGS